MDKAKTTQQPSTHIMSKFIDINDRSALRDALAKLSAATKPVWGKMTARQMVEHLIEQVEYTNGKKTATLDVPPEDAEKGKQAWVYSDIEIPRNVFLKVLSIDYLYPSLQTAIEQLFKELEGFDNYFRTSGATIIHGGFGPLNHAEWLIWHGKHFTHHLKQFGLI
nr:hypothetical protein [uncultured Mucilaginibacter sp.]